MMHLHVCSLTLIYAGPRLWGLDTSKQFDPGHTRETSDLSGPKSFDSGQNGRPSVGSFFIVVHEVCLVTMQREM